MNGRLSVCLSVCLSLTTVACTPVDDGTEARSSSSSGAPPGYERALAAAHEIQASGATLRLSDPWFHASGEFGYLSARLTEAGKLSRAVGIDSHGKVWSLSEAEQRFAEAHVSTWGALTLEAAVALQEHPADEPISLMLWYDRTAVEDGELERIVEGLDADAQVSRSPDVVWLTVDPVTARQDVAWLPFARRVHVAAANGIVPASIGSEGVPSSAADSNSDHTYLPDSITGFEVKVGLVEGYTRCGIRETHSAFDGMQNITYFTPPDSCSTVQDCKCHAFGGNGTDICAMDRGGTKRCIGRHPTQVASRIGWSFEETPYHAAKADLFVGLVGSWIQGVQAVGLLDVYKWLDRSEVRIVNESFVRDDAGINDRSLLTDWFARNRGMTFVQAAGNLEDNAEADQEIGCAGFNSLCVGMSNRKVVSGVYFQEGMVGTGYDEMPTYPSTYPVSAWKNVTIPALSLPAGTETTEWEKPDLVADGWNADVVNVDNDTGWTTDDGTSLSAPAVTGLVALMSEDCDKVFSPAANRSLLRTSAWSDQRFERTSGYLSAGSGCPSALGFPFYPTAGLGCDFAAGAGIVDARHLRGWCHPPSSCGEGETPCRAENEEEIDVDDERWEDVPPWLIAADEEDFLNNLRQTPTSLQGIRQDTDARWLHLHDYGALESGARVRATLSFYSCPSGATDGSSVVSYGGGDISALRPHVNFDLALIASVNGQDEVIFVAESFGDSNEGFDIVLPDDADGVKLYVVGPATWPACQTQDDKSIVSTTVEPMHWSTVWWN